MKARLVVAMVALSGAVLAASRFQGTFGGRSTCGGLQFTYARRTSHSTLTLSFATGLWSGYCGGRGFFPGAASSLSWRGWAPGGVYLYRGWVPRSPHLARWSPPHAGFGPFEFVDAVVFTGPPGGMVFGYRARPPARQAAPRDPALERLPASKLVDLGDEHFAAERFRRAVECYRLAVRKAPADPTAAFALGHGLFALGRYDEAGRTLRRAVRLFPDIVAVAMNRRDFYSDPTVFERQLARLADHVRRNPTDTQARFLLAYNYYFSGRLAEARDHFAALGPRDLEAAIFLRSPLLRR